MTRTRPRNDRASGGDGHPLRATWLIGWRELAQLVAGYVAMVAVWSTVGALALGKGRDNGLVRADERVARWFVDRRTPTWDSWSWLGSMLADTVVKIIVTAVVVLVMLKLWHRWLEPTVVAVSLVLEAMAFITITWIVQRPRPDVPKLEGSPVDSSFPSGHTAAAAAYGAIAVALAWRYRHRIVEVIGAAVVTLVVAAVALARMYRGMHHLSDVVAGAILGASSVAVVAYVLAGAERRRHRSGGSITT